MHNQPREPQPYEDCQAKSIHEFGWTSQGMDWGWSQGIKSHHTDVSRNLATVVAFLLLSHSWTTDNVRGVLPGLRRRRTGLLPSGPKSSFQMRASFAFHLETKVLESGGRVEKLIAQVAWSPVLSFHNLWLIWGVICWCWSIVFFENQRHCTRLPRNFGALHASFCWPAFYRFWFNFPAGFGTCLHCQKHQKLVKWPWCYCAWLASKLTRPEPHRESMGYCQEENEKRDQKMQMSWRPLSKKPGLPYHLSSATNWSPPCHAELRQ